MPIIIRLPDPLYSYYITVVLCYFHNQWLLKMFHNILSTNSHIFHTFPRSFQLQDLCKNFITQDTYSEGLLALYPTFKLVSCPWLPNDNDICSYPLYVEAASSMHNLRTHHAAVTKRPLNTFIWCTLQDYGWVDSMKWLVDTSCISGPLLYNFWYYFIDLFISKHNTP